MILSTPMQVEWPDGKREAVLFLFEEETGRFSIHRMARYCLHIGEMIKTDRVVPVVIFLKPGSYMHGRRVEHIPVFPVCHSRPGTDSGRGIYEQRQYCCQGESAEHDL